MRPGLGVDHAGGHLLDAVVADGIREARPVGYGEAPDDVIAPQVAVAPDSTESLADLLLAMTADQPATIAVSLRREASSSWGSSPSLRSVTT